MSENAEPVFVPSVDERELEDVDEGMGIADWVVVPSRRAAANISADAMTRRSEEVYI